MIIALTVIGANIPDYDHKVKRDTVYKIIILGLILFITCYILNLHYFIGLDIVLLGIIFYFSNHRSFTHSILGLFLLTLLITLILILAIDLIPISYNYWLIAILTSLLGFLFLNKKLLYIFIPSLFISLFFIGTMDITYIQMGFAIFLGIFSHLILDSFSQAGIKLFAPFSSKKFYKKFGIISMVFLISLIILNYYFKYLI